MPIYETACSNKTCDKHGVPVEHYYRTSGEPLYPCENCGGETRLLISQFAVVFTGPITARYNDKKKERPDLESHWVWEKKTPDGKPRQRYIETWQQRKEYMKQEGLRDDIGVIDAPSDGKGSGNNGCGMPGAWV